MYWVFSFFQEDISFTLFPVYSEVLYALLFHSHKPYCRYLPWIVVLISVFFLKLVFTAQEDLVWLVLILPITIVVIAVSLKLAHFD